MVVLNESKIKYERLNELLEKFLIDIQFSQNINIIIDVKEVLRKFFRPDVIDLNNRSDQSLKEELSSDLISIISHYRNFFYKKGKYSSFFFLYSENKCEAILKELPTYKEEYYKKYFESEDEEEKRKREIVKDSIKIIKKVISLIPNIFFIDTSEFDELVFTKAIISKSKKNELNIICSNDNLMVQCLNNHTIILNMKGPTSNILEENTAISIITKKDNFKFSSNLAELLFAIAGEKKNSFPNIPGFALIKAANLIQSLINESLISDMKTISIPIKFASLSPNNNFHKTILENKEFLTKNFSLISGNNLLFSNKIKIEEALNIPKGNFSKEYLMELNSKVFSNFPISLDMLLKGEKV